MSSNIELAKSYKSVQECFDQVASLGRDITNSVYDNFFESNSDSGDLENLRDLDDRSKGKMLDQACLLLMGEHRNDDYLKFETRMHASYGASFKLYLGFFRAVEKTIKTAMKDNWRICEEKAWNQVIDDILQRMGSDDRRQ